MGLHLHLDCPGLKERSREGEVGRAERMCQEEPGTEAMQGQ